MRLIPPLLILLLLNCSISAQKKISADISFSFLYPVGKDQHKEYWSRTNNWGIAYSSTKKFQLPYFSLMPRISYDIIRRLNIGLQSGIYVHYLESYSYQRKNRIFVPLLLTTRYSVLNFWKNELGINLAAGIIFFKIAEYYNYKNGYLLNGSIFYSINKGSIIKLGMEEQFDHVAIPFGSPNLPSETFKYYMKRLAVSLSYGVIIK